VSNLLRLLKLDESVQEAVLDAQLTAGHARALVSLAFEDQKLLAQQAISLQWSVRELETAVRRLQPKPQPTDDVVASDKPILSTQAQAWQAQLMQKLGAQVKLTMNAKGRGKIEIPFDHEQTLSLLIEKLMEQKINT
jgi:ParB family chromosome partitioning protein